MCIASSSFLTTGTLSFCLESLKSQCCNSTAIDVTSGRVQATGYLSLVVPLPLDTYLLQVCKSARSEQCRIVATKAADRSMAVERYGRVPKRRSTTYRREVYWCLLLAITPQAQWTSFNRCIINATLRAKPPKGRSDSLTNNGLV